MSETINVEPNESGRVIIKLYGKEMEIDDSMFDENGQAEIKAFGKDYIVECEAKKAKKTTKRATRKSKKVEETLEEEPAVESDEVNDAEPVQEESDQDDTTEGE